jgi:DNA polymerase I-like protein with 3'-5' exonuclease and polymerase domains|tara:strand:- start:8197 stop:10143 length:1947 start_codon:yes stop_codon:yes gene_type:complete
MQIPLFDPKTKWIAPEVLPDFDNVEAIAIDLETCDLDLKNNGPGWPWKGGHVAGVALCFKKGKEFETHYLPIGHQLGQNLDKSLVRRYLQNLCKTNIPKVFHNALYDVGWLRTEGITVINGELFDTMSGAALLDENRKSYSLDNIGKSWLNIGKDETLLKEAGAAYSIINIKKDMWKLPPKFVGPYAEQDTLVTLKLWEYEKPRLTKDNLDKLMELEMSIIPLLIEMRSKGIRVDIDKTQQTRKKLLIQQSELNKELFRRFNVKIDVWASASIAKAFDTHRLEYPRTQKTGAPSFTKEFLENHPHELTDIILRVRKIDKTVSTFIDGMILGSVKEGRIHAELHPLKSDEGGAVSGRFSCSRPNLQQTSARDPEFGPMVRKLFLPEKGQKWGALDYSSQEPRLTVHYAHKTNQPGAKEAVENYNQNENMDYHQMVADLAGISRKHAKTINLGLAYGMGQVKLCASLGLPTEKVTDKRGSLKEIAGEEGLRIIAQYHKKVPFIKGLTSTCSNLAQDRGYIRTIEGRLCRFDMWEPANGSWEMPVEGRAKAVEKWGGQVRRAFTHKALNRLIQGSAADMTKLAMRNLWQEGLIPLHQMHDELDFSFETKEQADKCVEIMEQCLPLSVPVVVDAEFGNTWADAQHEWGKGNA